jgi:hypothetical protein
MINENDKAMPAWLTSAYSLIDKLEYKHVDQKTGAKLMLRGCINEQMADRVVQLYQTNITQIFGQQKKEVNVQYIPEIIQIHDLSPVVKAEKQIMPLESSEISSSKVSQTKVR